MVDKIIQSLTNARDLIQRLDVSTIAALPALIQQIEAEIESAIGLIHDGKLPTSESDRVAKLLAKPLGFALANTFLDIKTHADQQVVLSVALMAANRDAAGGA